MRCTLAGNASVSELTRFLLRSGVQDFRGTGGYINVVFMCKGVRPEAVYRSSLQFEQATTHGCTGMTPQLEAAHRISLRTEFYSPRPRKHPHDNQNSGTTIFAHPLLSSYHLSLLNTHHHSL
jgi:hypothetical protein